MSCCRDKLNAQFTLPRPSLLPPNINCHLSHFGAESQTTVVTEYFFLALLHCGLNLHGSHECVMESDGSGEA